jgi:hypothetical protein
VGSWCAPLGNNMSRVVHEFLKRSCVLSGVYCNDSRKQVVN